MQSMTRLGLPAGMLLVRRGEDIKRGEKVPLSTSPRGSETTTGTYHPSSSSSPCIARWMTSSLAGGGGGHVGVPGDVDEDFHAIAAVSGGFDAKACLRREGHSFRRGWGNHGYIITCISHSTASRYMLVYAYRGYP